MKFVHINTGEIIEAAVVQEASKVFYTPDQLTKKGVPDARKHPLRYGVKCYNGRYYVDYAALTDDVAKNEPVAAGYRFKIKELEETLVNLKQQLLQHYEQTQQPEEKKADQLGNSQAS